MRWRDAWQFSEMSICLQVLVLESKKNKSIDKRRCHLNFCLSENRLTSNDTHNQTPTHRSAFLKPNLLICSSRNVIFYHLCQHHKVSIFYTILMVWIHIRINQNKGLICSLDDFTEHHKNICWCRVISGNMNFSLNSHSVWICLEKMMKWWKERKKQPEWIYWHILWWNNAAVDEIACASIRFSRINTLEERNNTFLL